MKFLLQQNIPIGVLLDNDDKIFFSNWTPLPPSVKKSTLIFLYINQFQYPKCNILQTYPTIYADSQTMGAQHSPFHLDLDPERALIQSFGSFQAACAVCIEEDGTPDTSRRRLLAECNKQFDIKPFLDKLPSLDTLKKLSIFLTAPAYEAIAIAIQKSGCKLYDETQIPNLSAPPRP